jgi:hypothetical protein
MRKLALTAFLLLYTLSVVVRTMERTEVWAAERLSQFGQHRSTHGPGFAETGKHSPHQVQTKLLEDGWVLVLPFVASTELPHSEKASHYCLAGFVANPNSRTLSSRAPPLFV